MSHCASTAVDAGLKNGELNGEKLEGGEILAAGKAVGVAAGEAASEGVRE